MKLRDAFWLGSKLHYVRRCEHIKPHVKGEDYLLQNLRTIESALKEHGLNHQVKNEIAQWIEKLDKKYGEKKSIDDDDATALHADCTRWERLISRLLFARPVLELTRIGTLNQQALIETSEGNPSAFFDEKTWSALSKIEKSDLSDAAKCLLAGISTPAAMVALRGAEATVKKYYGFKVGKPARKKQWGPMVEELESRAKELKVKKTFLGYLDYVRDAKRNFAEHPNTIFEQREAELIFMQVLNLVHDTYLEMSRAY